MGKQKCHIFSYLHSFRALRKSSWNSFVSAGKIQQRYVLAVMLFVAVMIGLSERSVLPMAITRMVAIPNQSANVTTTTSSESFCAAPEWAASEGDGSVIIDQAVGVLCFDLLTVNGEMDFGFVYSFGH